MKTILIITDNLQDQINGVVTTYKNLETCAVLDGYNVVYLDPGRFGYIDCPVYNEVKIAYTRKMGQEIEKISPDYIHIATEGPLGLCGRKYLSLVGWRYTTAYHTRFPEGIKQLVGIPERITWAYVRWFHKNSTKILTTTDTMVQDLRAHGFTGDVIPWTRGVDRTIFNPSYRTDSVAGRPILLCVCRVSKEKNLEAFCELDYPGATKIVVGDGPYREYLMSRYPDVHFPGARTGADLAKYYAMADVFVFPSKWDTFGIVMIEAMACGTPVAAYDVAGPKDVIDQGITGFMVSESVGLRAAVDQCIMMDRAQVEQASHRWSWENCWKIFKDSLTLAK